MFLLAKSGCSFYFWLCWVSIAARAFSLVAPSGGYSLVAACGLLITAEWFFLLRSTGSRVLGF